MYTLFANCYYYQIDRFKSFVGTFTKQEIFTFILYLLDAMILLTPQEVGFLLFTNYDLKCILMYTFIQVTK